MIRPWRPPRPRPRQLAERQHGVFDVAVLDRLGFTPESASPGRVGTLDPLYDGVYRIAGAPSPGAESSSAPCLAGGLDGSGIPSERRRVMERRRRRPWHPGDPVPTLATTEAGSSSTSRRRSMLGCHGRRRDPGDHDRAHAPRPRCGPSSAHRVRRVARAASNCELACELRRRSVASGAVAASPRRRRPSSRPRNDPRPPRSHSSTELRWHMAKRRTSRQRPPQCLVGRPELAGRSAVALVEVGPRAPCRSAVRATIIARLPPTPRIRPRTARRALAAA